MSDGELTRLEVLRDLDQHRLTTTAAAQLLGLERHQVCRLLKAYRVAGPAGLISKRRGRPSNRRKPEELRIKPPANKKDLHRPLRAGDDLDDALAWKEERTLSHSGAAHVAFDDVDGLGPCVVVTFVAQSHTPHDCCVRFVAAVADDPATLGTGRLATALPGPDFHRLDPASLPWRTDRLTQPAV